VLSHFRRDERIQLPEIINRACECCISWALEGVEKSMNIFNRKEQKE
jgi:peptidyl-tRNA hydrolase